MTADQRAAAVDAAGRAGDSPELAPEPQPQPQLAPETQPAPQPQPQPTPDPAAQPETAPPPEPDIAPDTTSHPTSDPAFDPAGNDTAPRAAPDRAAGLDPDVPPYARRLARVFRALQLLALHPDGLSVADLARQLDAPPTQVREDLVAFYTADVAPTELGGVLRSPVLEFVGADGTEDDPARAVVVRVVDERPAAELGVAVLDAAELATVYDAARALASLDPDDADLAGALAALERTALAGATVDAPAGSPADGSPEPAPEPAPDPTRDLAATLRAAARDGRRVRIVYARAWRPGVAERVVEPYRVVSTRRGWELDAGPPDADGGVRSYLLTGVRSAVVLDEEFLRPPDVDALVAEHRREQPVDLVLAQGGLWAAGRYAERVDVIDQDEEWVSVRAWLLPPVADRAGLIVLVAGPGSFVVGPPDLRDADRDVARALLSHHERTAEVAP